MNDIHLKRPIVVAIGTLLLPIGVASFTPTIAKVKKSSKASANIGTVGLELDQIVIVAIGLIQAGKLVVVECVLNESIVVLSISGNSTSELVRLNGKCRQTAVTNRVVASGKRAGKGIVAQKQVPKFDESVSDVFG